MHSVEIVNRYREARNRLWPKEPPRPVRIPEPEPAPIVKKETKPAYEPEAPRMVRPISPDYFFDWRKPFAELCLRYGVSPTEVLSDCRKRKLLPVRVEMIHLLRERGWSFPKIGKVLGRDHSSVLHLYHTYNVGKPQLDGLRSKHETFMNEAREKCFG